jgi:hypothetical protein
MENHRRRGVGCHGGGRAGKSARHPAIHQNQQDVRSERISPASRVEQIKEKIEMEQENKNSSSDKDMLYLMGGAALVLLGAGLIMSHPAIRKTVTSGLSSVLPDLQGKFAPNFDVIGSDIQRYLKLKSM